MGVEGRQNCVGGGEGAGGHGVGVCMCKGCVGCGKHEAVCVYVCEECVGEVGVRGQHSPLDSLKLDPVCISDPHSLKLDPALTPSSTHWVRHPAPPA